jgi:hypothetical protein
MNEHIILKSVSHHVDKLTRTSEYEPKTIKWGGGGRPREFSLWSVLESRHYPHYTASNGRMSHEWWIRQDLDRSGSNITEVLSQHLLESVVENHKNPPIRTVEVLAEVRTRSQVTATPACSVVQWYRYLLSDKVLIAKSCVLPAIRFHISDSALLNWKPNVSWQKNTVCHLTASYKITTVN